MQTVYKERLTSFSRKSILLFLGNGVRLLVQLVILYFYSHRLSVIDYGYYQAVFLFLNLFGIITLFGLPALILSMPEKNIQTWILVNRKKVFTAVLLLFTITLISLYKLTPGFSNPLRYWLIIALLTQNIAGIAESLAIKRNRITRLFFINLFFNLMWLVAHIGLLYIDYSLSILIQLIIASYLLKFFTLAFLRSTNHSTSTTENVGAQWLSLGLFDVVSALSKWIDKWVILIFISVSQFAIYFNGAYEIPLFGLMVSAVGSILIVDFTRNDSDNTHKLKLYKHSVKLLSSAVIPIFFFLLFFYKPVFLWIFGGKYIDSLPIFFICLWILPIRMANFTAALQALQRSDIILKGALYDLGIALVLMAVFYPLFNLPGIALAFVSSTWIQAGYYTFHTSKLMGAPFSAFIPFKHIVSLLLICLPLQFIMYWCSRYFFSDIWLLTSLIASCSIALIAFFKSERKRID